MTEDELRIENVRAACLQALITDGEHHKQWYLEQILLLIVGSEDYEELRQDLEWEEGVPS